MSATSRPSRWWRFYLGCGVGWLLSACSSSHEPSGGNHAKDIVENNHEDQRASLEKYGQGQITNPTTGYIENQAVLLSPALFLDVHSALVAYSPADPSVAPNIRVVRSDEAGNGTLGYAITSGLAGTAAKEAIAIGSAAPVSTDGYFLTACHTLSDQGAWIIYRITSIRQAALGPASTADEKIAIAPCRIVFADAVNDFAIIKAPFATPTHLDFRATPLSVGQVVFAGSWVHHKGGGLVESWEATRLDPKAGGHSYRRIQTSIPIIRGDSGSPLIDQAGKLCGVMSQGLVGHGTKPVPRSSAVMLDEKTIAEIIARDRAEHAR